jgi:hypothetical protein
MTTNNHPITPPPELVQQWDSEAVAAEIPGQFYLATQAARWGADQELEACCEWLRCQNLVTHWALIPSLRAARRPKPKPPSKEEALDALYISFDRGYLKKEAAEIIRRALEQLDD